MLAKIDLSTDTSFWQVVTELHWKKSNILGKNPLPISLFNYSFTTLWRLKLFFS